MATVTISKAKVKKEGGVVILPLQEYRKLLERVVPTYYLTGKAAKALDKLVKKGSEDYRKGKTRVLGSLAELD